MVFEGTSFWLPDRWSIRCFFFETPSPKKGNSTHITCSIFHVIDGAILIILHSRKLSLLGSERYQWVCACGERRDYRPKAV